LEEPGWVLKKRKTGIGLICRPITLALRFGNKRRRHAFTHEYAFVFSFLQLGTLGGAVLKQPHF